MFKRISQQFIIACVAIAIFTGLSTNMALAKISNPTGIMTNLSTPNLLSFFLELNMSPEVVYTSDGMSYLTMSDPDSGLSIAAAPEACEEQKCVAITLAIIFSGDQLSSERLDYYNKNINFIKVSNFEDLNYVMITRYEIADYGIPRGNLESSLANLIALALSVKNDM